MTHLSYLFAAYTIIWLVLFGYIYTLFQRNRSLKHEIDTLKDILAKDNLKKNP